MRTHIAKSLQTRCKAIQRAVATYNAAVVELGDPTKTTLDWSKVSHYAFLEQFEILRDARQDLSDKPWAKLAIRETMKQNERIKRAKEEIIRCNVEIRRLHTAIRDEQSHFKELLPKVKVEGDAIYGALREHVARRKGVNEQILARIYQIYALEGFTGIPSPGTRKGATPRGSEETNLMANNGDDEEQIEDEEGEDLFNDDIGGLVDYISNLRVSHPRSA